MKNIHFDGHAHFHYISRSPGEMYSGHGHLSVSACLCVPRRIPALLHGPGCNLGEWQGCPLVVHYWADLQSVNGFRCYDKQRRTRNVSECLSSLYAWFFLQLQTTSILCGDLHTFIISPLVHFCFLAERPSFNNKRANLCQSVTVNSCCQHRSSETRRGDSLFLFPLLPYRVRINSGHYYRTNQRLQRVIGGTQPT